MIRNSLRRPLVFFTAALLSFLPPSLNAQDTGISGTNLEFFQPTLDPYGLFGVQGPSLLKAGELFFKINQGFASSHLFQVAVNNQPVDLVERIATTDLVASLGVSDFLNIGLDLPVHLYAREANFTSLASFTTQSLGDIRMAMKFRLLEEKGKRPGMALLFSNSFPTGNENKFLGTSHMVPALDLLVGKKFQHVSAMVNVGGHFPRQKNVLGVDFDDQITYGAGVKVPFGFFDRLLSVIAEVRGHFQPDRVAITTAPVEFTVGLQKEFRNGLTATAGGGGAWNNAIGNPRVRGILSIGYLPRFVKPFPRTAMTEREEKSPQNEFENRIRTTLYFKPGAVQPTAESSQWVHEVAVLMKDHPEIKKIIVEGNSDGRGSRAKNLRLSRRRAKRVKRMIVQDGINPRRIEVHARGEGRPAASNKTKRGRRMNRRVEIVVQ